MSSEPPHKRSRLDLTPIAAPPAISLEALNKNLESWSGVPALDDLMVSVCCKLLENPDWVRVLDVRIGDRSFWKGEGKGETSMFEALSSCVKSQPNNAGQWQLLAESEFPYQYPTLAPRSIWLIMESLELLERFPVRTDEEQDVCHMEERRKATSLDHAWKMAYHGNHHKILFDSINTIASSVERNQPYANQIAILQSSGTGKSRMVHEQANLVFTIPFNLRDEKDNRDGTFPSPDSTIQRYLTQQENLTKQETGYLRLFDGIFKTILEELDNQLSANENIEVSPSWWSRHLEGEGVREALYNKSVEAAKVYENPLDTLSPEKSAENRAQASLRQLLDKVPSDESRKLKLVVYFDEAQPLTRQWVTGGKKTLFDVLSGCLNSFLGSPVFFIFLSTTFSRVHFAPPRALAGSSRIQENFAVINPPITETPFGCYGFRVDPGKHTLKDTSSLKYMSNFGRPVFYTLAHSGKLDDISILALARAKLIGTHKIHTPPENEAALLAVLDVQLSLEYEPRRQSVRRSQQEEKETPEVQLVQSHMRMAYSVPQHRIYIRSGYPSEPLLAEAAAEQLWTWRELPNFSVVGSLTDIAKAGILDRGELGELTGRVLLLDAYHRAVEKEQSGNPPNYSAGCRLINFIKELFTDHYAQLVLDSTPDNMEGIPFKETFKESVICFTHFARAGDDAGATSTASWAAYYRHAAIMCKNGQKKVDCILPVQVKGAKICKHLMTSILVQFKRESKANTVAEYTIDQSDINHFPGPQGKTCACGATFVAQPYVSLIMELAAGPKRKTAHIPHLGERHHKSTETHPRYNIFVYGCSPSVYRGVGLGPNEKLYTQFMATQELFAEHPRTNTHQILREMQPFRCRGWDCFNWIPDDEILHGHVLPLDQGFYVGDDYPVRDND